MTSGQMADILDESLRRLRVSDGTDPVGVAMGPFEERQCNSCGKLAAEIGECSCSEPTPS